MITFNIVNKNIAGSVGTTPFSVPYSKELWEKMVSTQEEFSAAESMQIAKHVMEKFSGFLVVNTKKSIEEITPNITFDPNKSTYHLRVGQRVSQVAIPKIFVDKVKYAHDEGLPVEPLIKFLTRALRNPNVTSNKSAETFLGYLCNYVFHTFVSPELYRQAIEAGFSHGVATEMATVPQTPITLEGLMVLKKVVSPLELDTKYMWIDDGEGNPKRVLREGFTRTVDPETGKVTISEPQYAEQLIMQPALMGNRGDAFRCGTGEKAPLGHIIKVNEEMSLDSWDQVDCNPMHSCVKGLHCGNQDYIKGFENEGTITVNCFVCPSEVGTVAVNENNGVIRVKSMFIHSIKSRKIENKNLYHSSHYAKLADERWEKAKIAAITQFEKEEQELMARIKAKKEFFM